ncbi:MAG: hypothetical protein NZL83_01175 [Candidatus Absconditabacterales bacterium]|nr:hypothetical protein [Candidatus Absconditabacterales bacterium]
MTQHIITDYIAILIITDKAPKTINLYKILTSTISPHSPLTHYYHITQNLYSCHTSHSGS